MTPLDGQPRGTLTEQQLLDAGWEVEVCSNDRHALRKGGPATYRIYTPPDYRRNWRRPELPQGAALAWTLEDAMARV